MRIISSFKDYYDGVQRFGQDVQPVYLRKPMTEEWTATRTLPRLSHGFYRGRDIDNSIIGFCGKIYGVLVVPSPSARNVQANVTSLEDLDRSIDNLFPKKEREAYWLSDKNTRHYVPFVCRPLAVKYFQEFETIRDSCAHVFEQKRCPVFVIRRHPQKWWEVTYNDSLKGFGFERLFPPYQAFQEIAMFLNNMAMPDKPIPHVPDEVMAEAKGFDKFSFRKPKKKK